MEQLDNRVHVLSYPKDTEPSKEIVPEKQYRVGTVKDLEFLLENVGKIRNLVLFTTTERVIESWTKIWEREPVSVEQAIAHLS